MELQSNKIEKICIFDESLNRLSLILQEESNIRQMFTYSSLKYLLLIPNQNENENQSLNLTIINTDIQIIHQSMQKIFWQIQSDQLASSFELAFLLKVNTVEKTTLVSVNITLLNLSVITSDILNETSSIVKGIIEHINNFLSKDEYYRSQIESIIIAVPRKSIWDNITQWKFVKENSLTNCFDVQFKGNPGAKGSIIQFVDHHNILNIYNVTHVDDDDNNNQWYYNLLQNENTYPVFQQIKFVLTLIESNITLVSMESCFSQNVFGELLEKMKQHKKKMLEGIKTYLESGVFNLNDKCSPKYGNKQQ